MTQESQKGRISVYACGGAGINIGQTLSAETNAAPITYADTIVYSIDTSRSNIFSGKIDSARLYHIDNKDGSGKIRRENLEPIKAHAKKILQKHEPLDFSIVLSSASGGSGSVIAPVLFTELLKQGKPAVALTIESGTSVTELQNTLNTVLSYESIAKAVNAPGVVAYYANTREVSRADVDIDIKSMIVSLAMLFSKNNAEMDGQDLLNWVRFDRPTGAAAGLYVLTMVDGDTADQYDDQKYGDVISVASLSVQGDHAALPITPDYHAQGYVTGTLPAKVTELLPVHFYISNGFFHNKVKELNARLAAHGDAKTARITRPALLSGNEDVDDSGLVV